MTTTKSLIALFAVILLEGYVVLSSELVAIRLTIPFVGSGTDTVSVIIAAVLMPLAFGYHFGGRFKPGFQKTLFGGYSYISVREKLISNMLISLVFLLFAISYEFLFHFFTFFIENGLANRVLLTALYSMMFITIPVYLLGQTIPLTCNYFSQDRLAKITGRILFFSTFGSFLGAVFSTLVLMSLIGVNNTAIVNFVILGLLITLLSKEKISPRIGLVWALVIAGAVSNSDRAVRDMGIVEHGLYSTISVLEADGKRHLLVNGNASSRYSDAGEKFEYASFIEFVAIDEAWKNDDPLNVLVLGAGGFTIGAEDDFNNYDYVDIEKSLQEISEEYLLKEKLMDNKTFHAMPARAYLTQSDKYYDVIILDVFSGALSIPEHLVTHEFFQQMKSKLKPRGVMAANLAISPNFQSKFSRTLDNTIRSVFPHVSRHVIRNNYSLWEDDESKVANVVYMYRNREDEDPKAIYSDTKNRAFLDRPADRN